jgi:hypothetical protein
LELPVGTIKKSNTCVGDKLVFVWSTGSTICFTMLFSYFSSP